MSEVNANIPLSVNKPDFMSPSQVISLQQMTQQMQAQKLQQAETLKSINKQNQIQQRLSQPGAMDGSGLFTPQTLADITKLDASTGIHLTGQVQKIRDDQSASQSRQIQDRAAKLKLTESLQKSQNEVLEAAVSFVDSTMPKASQEEKDRAVALKVQEGLERQQKSGLYDYTEEQWNNLRKYNYNYADSKSRVTPLKEVLAERKVADAEKKAESVPLSDVGRARYDENRGLISHKDADAVVSKKEGIEQQKLATERLQIEQEKLQLARDKQAKKEEGESGRSAVFTNRMVTSANEAMKSLKNIAQLPTNTSRGIFGGRQQEGGLLAASKESLTNKLTSEDVQLYNVMSAGIQRNLASIEAVGLMPSGSLTHQMDSVVIKEGDTQLTKASKLAEIRQILEGGLEPVLANPKVPKEMKELVKNILTQVTTAVPYTQEDVIKLMSSDNKDTLGSIIKNNTRDPESGAIVRKHTGDSGGGLGVETFPDAPKTGSVIKGYKFKGGDPSDSKNWEKQ